MFNPRTLGNNSLFYSIVPFRTIVNAVMALAANEDSGQLVDCSRASKSPDDNGAKRTSLSGAEVALNTIQELMARSQNKRKRCHSILSQAHKLAATIKL